MIFKQLPKDFDLICGALIIQTHENHAAVLSPFAKYHLAEVFIIRYHYPVFGNRFCQNLAITDALSRIEN